MNDLGKKVLPQKIFIVGNSRSGTTMVAKILGRHSLVCDLKELHFIEQLVSGDEFTSTEFVERDKAIALASSLLSIIRDGYFFATNKEKYRKDALLILNGDISQNQWSISDIYSKVVRNETNLRGKRIPLDQTPRNVFYIQEILNKYPESKIIILVRDPRDICLSQKNKWKRRYLGANIPLIESIRAWANYHPIVISKLWKQAVIAGSKFKDESRVLTIRFEDILNNPTQYLQALCNHCNIQVESGMLDIAISGSSQNKDKSGVVGIDSSRVYGWKNGNLNDVEIDICESICKNELVNFGYRLEEKKVNYIFKFLFWLLLPFKLLLSLLLNLKRVKNLKSWFFARIKKS